VSFITLKTDATVVVFGNVSLEKGQKVRVEGRVSSYLGKREIIAERIVNV
jgi:DNA/RNA endonuclease YhcR with UshA esterase domain